MSFVETMCTWDDCGSDAIYCVDHAREFMRLEIDALTSRAESAEALLRECVARHLDDGGNPHGTWQKILDHFAQWSGK